jgi:hypothetical protein
MWGNILTHIGVHHTARHGIVITILDGRCPYLRFRFLLTWHDLHDFVSDRIVEHMPFQYIVAFIASSSRCVLGAAGSGGTITLRTFGVVWELSFYHPGTLCTCHQQV